MMAVAISPSVMYGGCAAQPNNSEIISDYQDNSISEDVTSGDVISSAETSKPETSKPETSKPETSKPETSEPETSKPETSKPETSKPETSEPETSKPETSKPETSKPETSKPETSKPETSKPETSKPEASTNAPTESANENKDSTPKEEQEKTYAMNNSHGDRLEAKPGYTSASYVKEMYDTSTHASSISIPPIFDYTDYTFSMGREELASSGCYCLTFKCDEAVDLEFIEEYVKDLEQYGFTLAKKWNINKQMIKYFMNCDSPIASPADSLLDESYDMTVATYEDYTKSSVIFYYPAEVSISTGNADMVYNKINTSTSFTDKGGKYIFATTGWGEADNDRISITIDAGYYKTGDVLKKKDFEEQSSAGDNRLCYIYVSGNTFERDNNNKPLYVADMSDVTVTILENSDYAMAISYVIKASCGSYVYCLEGICVEEFGGSQISDDTDWGTDTSGSISGHDKCPFCSGSGFNVCSLCNGSCHSKCYKCSGGGLVQCSLCRGTGHHWANGMFNTCYGCSGHGSITCTACQRGFVNCISCNGKGRTKCNFCNGLGWR